MEGPCSVTTIRATGGRQGQHELTPSRAARSPPYRQGDRGSGGAAGEKRARAFSADQPPEAEEQELEPGRISAPCWPGVPRPPAPIPHPWAFPPRPQPHEATSSSPCDTPKAALLGTVEPAGTLEPGEPGGWRGLGCRGGDGGRVGSQEVRTPGAGLPVQNPSATSRLAAWRPLSSRPVGLTPSPPCISHPPPCPLASSTSSAWGSGRCWACARGTPCLCEHQPWPPIQGTGLGTASASGHRAWESGETEGPEEP